MKIKANKKFNFNKIIKGYENFIDKLNFFSILSIGFFIASVYILSEFSIIDSMKVLLIPLLVLAGLNLFVSFVDVDEGTLFLTTVMTLLYLVFIFAVIKSDRTNYYVLNENNSTKFSYEINNDDIKINEINLIVDNNVILNDIILNELKPDYINEKVYCKNTLEQFANVIDLILNNKEVKNKDLCDEYYKEIKAYYKVSNIKKYELTGIVNLKDYKINDKISDKLKERILNEIKK